MNTLDQTNCAMAPINTPCPKYQLPQRAHTVLFRKRASMDSNLEH